MDGHKARVHFLVCDGVHVAREVVRQVGWNTKAPKSCGLQVGTSPRPDKFNRNPKEVGGEVGHVGVVISERTPNWDTVQVTPGT